MSSKKVEIEKNFGNIFFTGNTPAKTSFLGDLIVEFSTRASELDFEDVNVALPFGIEHKISHNSVTKYTYLFENFVAQEKVLRDVYTVVHETKPFARPLILKAISHDYKKWRGHVLKELRTDDQTDTDCIKVHSDFIIEKVMGDVKLRLNGIENIASVQEEIIDECVCIVVADAFFECKILENPNN
jgi:hypothetical protein